MPLPWPLIGVVPVKAPTSIFWDHSLNPEEIGDDDGADVSVYRYWTWAGYGDDDGEDPPPVRTQPPATNWIASMTGGDWIVIPEKIVLPIVGKVSNPLFWSFNVLAEAFGYVDWDAITDQVGISEAANQERAITLHTAPGQARLRVFAGSLTIGSSPR